MNAERVGGLFWVLVGAASVYGAVDLGVGSMSEPGSGFMAFVGGMLILILALVVCVKSYCSDSATQTRVAELWHGLQWWRSIAICFLVLAFILLFSTLGYFVSSLLLLMVMMRWLEGQSWWYSILVPIGVVLATYALFHTVLKINLPAGIFGI